jgi:hypothetical protein
MSLGLFVFLETTYSNLTLFSLGGATTLEREYSEVAGVQSLTKIRLLQ